MDLQLVWYDDAGVAQWLAGQPLTSLLSAIIGAFDHLEQDYGNIYHGGTRAYVSYANKRRLMEEMVGQSTTYTTLMDPTHALTVRNIPIDADRYASHTMLHVHTPTHDIHIELAVRYTRAPRLRGRYGA